VRSLRDFAPPVGVDWIALAIAAVALGLVAAEGFTGHRGLVGMLGIVAQLAAAPTLPHAVGWRTPLDVAVAAEAVAIAVICFGLRQNAPRAVGRHPA
jgi:membrane-bound ClpP family serine protease